ncbi:NAD(P)-binding protein [Hypoxylon sp. EC38]|nr:NAD(P)-binding protein [Hypoxylon sp. EC38]
MSRKTKYALVTGCGQGGIGEALVTEYTRRGIHAIATVLPLEPSEHLSRAGITWFPLDVTDDESVLALKKHISGLTDGYLDILSPVGYTMTAIDTDVNAVQKMFDVNVFGPIRMVHHFHEMLIRSSGIIVNMGSIGGIVPYVYGSSYNASKASMVQWSNTLRVEMAPLSVRVLTIIAGEVGTNILKNDHGRVLPEGSFYSPLATEFERHIHRIPSTTDRFLFAKGVVGKSLMLSPPAWFWTGSQTALIRFLNTFFPQTIFDWLFWSMFDLGKLKRSHAQRRDI